jgi:hypothetical protein
MTSNELVTDTVEIRSFEYTGVAEVVGQPHALHLIVKKLDLLRVENVIVTAINSLVSKQRPFSQVKCSFCTALVVFLSRRLNAYRILSISKQRQLA